MIGMQLLKINSLLQTNPGLYNYTALNTLGGNLHDFDNGI